MPRGGRRPGAGRKPKMPGMASVGGRVIPHPSVPPSTNYPLEPVEEFDAPDDLTAEERAIWIKQAPHAFRHRTLTKATAMAFERYCKVAVLERNEAKSSGMGGANHRGLLKQLAAYERDFLLAPIGRPMVEVPAVPQQSDDDAFFEVSGGRSA